MNMAIGSQGLKARRRKGMFEEMLCPEETIMADEDEFEGKLGNTTGPLVVKFWDGTPHIAQEALSVAAKRHSERIKFVCILSKDRKLKKKYGITHSPTFVFFKDGKEKSRIRGPSPPDALDIWCEINSI